MFKTASSNKIIQCIRASRDKPFTTLEYFNRHEAGSIVTIKLVCCNIENYFWEIFCEINRNQPYQLKLPRIWNRHRFSFHWINMNRIPMLIISDWLFYNVNTMQHCFISQSKKMTKKTDWGRENQTWWKQLTQNLQKKPPKLSVIFFQEDLVCIFPTGARYFWWLLSHLCSLLVFLEKYSLKKKRNL